VSTTKQAGTIWEGVCTECGRDYSGDVPPDNICPNDNCPSRTTQQVGHTPGPSTTAGDPMLTIRIPQSRVAAIQFAGQVFAKEHGDSLLAAKVAEAVDLLDRPVDDAAPEMLEALRETVRLIATANYLTEGGIHDVPGADKVLASARAAIAKAEGR
jgi:hypothetical protein